MWRILPLLLLACWGLAWAGEDQTLVFKEKNFQCKISSDWTLEDRPKFMVAARSPGQGVFFISAEPTNLQRVDVPAFINTFKAKLVADGFEIVSDDTIPFKGYPAYSNTFRKVRNNIPIVGHSINFIVGPLRYNIVASRKATDPMTDPAFQAAVDSFTILPSSSP